MIVYPALDLRGGRVVQWVGGRPDQERLSLPDPATVAQHWVELGFGALHVVDLDAALGRGSNAASVRAILDAVEVPVHVGGGIRSDHAADAMLEAGATRIVVGTRAVKEPAWLEALAARHPGRVIVAADARNGRVVARGWTVDAGLEVEPLLRRLRGLPLAAVLITDVGREGRLQGADTMRFRDYARATRHPLIASGGITSLIDLRALDGGGVAGVVVGMALYTGTIDSMAVSRRWGGKAPDA